MSKWKTLSTKTVYQNKWLRLDEDTVINPLGNESVYSRVELNDDFVSVIAIDDDRRIYLAKQYRYPLKALSWEVVSGQTDGEDSKKAAQRELREEAGVHAEIIKKIGTINLDGSISGSKGAIFIATELEKITEELDPLDDILQAKAFTITEIREMIKAGEIQSPHTIAAFYMALEHMEVLSTTQPSQNIT